MTELLIENLRVLIPDTSVEGGKRALVDDVSIRIADGEVVALVGESGSGKSVTARAVLGLFPDAATVEGRILVDGTEVLTASAQTIAELRHRTMSMIFQDPRTGINPVRRIGQFITESLTTNLGYSEARARSRGEADLREVGFTNPERHFRQYPHELSGGMLQRVMIAGAITTEPGLLLCDEATTALDVITQAGIIALLDRVRAQHGLSMLFITHNLDLAAAISDRCYVMRQGKVIEEGPSSQVLTKPREEYTRSLLASRPAEVASRERGPIDASSCLVVRDLGKSYGAGTRAVRAVQSIGFDVARGAAIGIVGQSGSGKSTVARMLVGLERPDHGSVCVDGVELINSGRRRMSRMERARHVQMVFQDPYLSLDPRVQVRAAVYEAARMHSAMRGAELNAFVDSLFDRVGLTKLQAESAPRRLSGGQRQRAAIARA
ncbi:MAG: ABC transporter ATP-binding protein, partial [Pseudolysinimonas sp.]